MNRREAKQRCCRAVATMIGNLYDRDHRWLYDNAKTAREWDLIATSFREIENEMLRRAGFMPNKRPLPESPPDIETYHDDIESVDVEVL